MWCEFVGVHLALLGVVLLVHGLGNMIEAVLFPHRFGVIPHAFLLLIALSIANLALPELEARTVPAHG